MILKKYANTIENLVVAIVTVMAINFIIIAPLRKEMNEQFKTVANIASQPRYSISNDFEKMRTREGGEINLNLSNELQDNHIEVKDSTAKEKVKKGLFKRIFKK